MYDGTNKDGWMDGWIEIILLTTLDQKQKKFSLI